MKILNQEHFENVKRYAESIGDTSLQKCLERLKSWEENPDCPSEISLYYDHAPYSFGFTRLIFLLFIREIRGPRNRNKAQVNFNKALRKFYLRLKPNLKKA